MKRKLSLLLGNLLMVVGMLLMVGSMAFTVGVLILHFLYRISILKPP